MKCQIIYTNKTGQFFLYALCFFLMFLLCFSFSSIVMAQDFDWGNLYNLQNLLYLDWAYDHNVYSWNGDYGMPRELTYPGDKGRSGFQSQAPVGVQVLSARSLHMLYTFWSSPSQYQSDQNYYSNYQNPYQSGLNPEIPPIPFYDKPYPHPTGFGSAIGPSPFSGKIYSHPTSPLPFSSSIGPSMFSGKTYRHPTSINLGW